MSVKVLVPSAGSPAGNNLIRSLRAGDGSLEIVGCHHSRFALQASETARNYAIPVLHSPNYAEALQTIVQREKVDLIIPNTDPDVTAIGKLRGTIPCRTFLPDQSVIELCSDKYRLYERLVGAGVPVPETCAIESLDQVADVCRSLSGHAKWWCRLRCGAGSSGAIPVKTADQVRAWISYWEEMRDIRPGSFTLSEYLPGRDLTVQCLMKEGLLVMSKAHERISYHVTSSAPSESSSTAALARMISEPDLVEVAVAAIHAVAPRESGVFFVDMKENAKGLACVTEVNAGRFANVPTIHDCAIRDNMAAAYVRLALGLEVPIELNDTGEETWYVVRMLDGVPRAFDSTELYRGVKDWREPRASAMSSV